MTLLSLGARGYKELLDQRKTVYARLREKLSGVAEKHGERVLHTPSNPISLGMVATPFLHYASKVLESMH